MREACYGHCMVLDRSGLGTGVHSHGILGVTPLCCLVPLRVGVVGCSFIISEQFQLCRSLA